MKCPIILLGAKYCHAMEQVKAVILIKDGDIKEIYSNTEINYCIIDHDQQEPIRGIHVTETIRGDLRELFDPEICRPAESKEQFRYLYETLRAENF
jgi:hypothetical protein